MIKRIKGGGELSRKLFAILMATGMLSSGAWANDVYVEQVGDNAIVSITQTGAGNLINGDVAGTSPTDPALIKGDLNVVTISQIGASNTLSLVLDSMTKGTGTTVNVSADGSGNNQIINCPTCNANTITSNVTGNNNNVTQQLGGNTLSSVINVAGSYNNVSHTTSGAGLHTADITIAGGGSAAQPNAVTLVQSGGMAKNASINSNGSNNNISVSQSD
jgi:hypothetical protein